jgi:uroporphyrinogen III methyltransferase/synthase
VYDRLVNPQLLRFAPPEAELIYVGKEPGTKAFTQEDINRLLADKARQGKVVVRLKGGDPFVFGRGGEEAEALAASGIPFRVVPGVTAAVAVPAYAGIPVTHRRFNSAFSVLTGHRQEGEDPALAPPPEGDACGTMIFLMGRQNLARICARLRDKGLDPDTPVAVIERGTTSDQRTVVGNLANIEEEVARTGLSNPVVTVVGRVVELRQTLAWKEKEPLFGRRIVVTRAASQAEGLRLALEDLGAEVLEFPLLEVAPPSDPRPLERAVERAARGGYDWLVFTSANGVEAFFGCLFARGRDARSLAATRIAAIGPATARALGSFGLRPEVLPPEYRAEGLLAALAEHDLAGRRVLLPRAEVVRPVLSRGLREMGAVVEEVTAYRTARPRNDPEQLRRLLSAGRVQAVTFTSPSAVKHYCELFGDEAASLLGGAAVASIGPVTSEAAREYGLRVDVEARPYTAEGLVGALVEYFKRST